jgi:hypothetical protein
MDDLGGSPKPAAHFKVNSPAAAANFSANMGKQKETAATRSVNKGGGSTTGVKQ